MVQETRILDESEQCDLCSGHIAAGELVVVMTERPGGEAVTLLCRHCEQTRAGRRMLAGLE